MGLIENFYDNTPIFFQNMMTSVAGFRNYLSRYGKSYHEHRDFLKKFDELPLKQKQDFQFNEMIHFIHFVKENSPFYRELYKDIDISNINNWEDFKELPVIEKETIRQNINDFVTVSDNAVEGHTGGTTGKSLIVKFTKEDMMKRMATLDHFKSRVGFENLKMKRATFNGKHIIPPGQTNKVFWRYNISCKQMIYSSFHLSEENLKYYVNSLNKFKPHAIDGFFSSMVDIANYIERNNITLEFTPIAIFPTSETLTESGRELLERVFRCKVYDQYASSEGAPFITECEHQNLHIELSSGYFEHLEAHNNEILVTSFTTHGTPLVRYRIGDSMVFGFEEGIKCPCGNNSPVIKEIQGRKLDYLYTAEGAKINGGNIANLFKNVQNALVRAQTIQNEIGKVTVLLEIDKDKYNTKNDDLIKNEFKHKFGRTTEVKIKHVNEIPREKSGKFRMIKNMID